MNLSKVSEIVAKILIEKKITFSVAESCTGGLISSKLTDIAGSSAFTLYNAVVYSSQAKAEILGISPHLIQDFGVVSEQVAISMAENIRHISGAEIGMGVTGIAGPSGGTPNQPVGLVYIGISNGIKSKVHKLSANPTWDRVHVKTYAADSALYFLKEFVEKNY